MTSQVSPRLSEPLAPEILELILAPRIRRELAGGIDDLIAVNEAHLVMLSNTGLIDAPDAAIVAQALLRIRQRGGDTITVNPALEDGYFNFEAALMAEAGPDAGGRLHLARSRNDINATLDRLLARHILIELTEVLIALRDTLLTRAAEHADAVMPGYTHMQPAQPITFGFYLLGVAEAFARDTARLFTALNSADHCPLGACALAGTSFAIDRKLVARLLGFTDVHIHAQDAVTSRDFAWDMAAAMLSMASTWGRFAQDLYIWGTQEFALVEFPDSIAGTSSIMPQKKNPIAVEFLKASTGDVIGGVTSMFAIIKGGHFSHAGDTGRSSLAPLWASLRQARDALIIARLVAEKVRPRLDVMRSRSSSGFSAATDLADSLVREAGMSFRQAHHAIAHMVKDALDGGIEASDLTVADIRSGLEQAVEERTVERALDPVASIAARVSLGSASPVETRRMIEIAHARLAQDKAGLAERCERLAAARAMLVRELRKLSDGG